MVDKENKGHSVTDMDANGKRVVIRGLTDVGRVRSANEDAYCIDEDLGFAMVADGMGGHRYGDVASREAAAIIHDNLKRQAAEPVSGNGGEEESSEVVMVREAVQRANGSLFERNEQDGSGSGARMGTTVVGFWLMEDREEAVVFHVGDSRLYLFRDGELQRLTRDHTMFQSWKEGGRNGEPPKRNILLRALGPEAAVEVDVTVHRITKGDYILLCSDGLFEMVPDSVIGDVLKNASAESMDSTCAHLVQLANDRGGKDNVTVILGFIPA